MKRALFAIMLLAASAKAQTVTALQQAALSIAQAQTQDTAQKADIASKAAEIAALKAQIATLQAGAVPAWVTEMRLACPTCEDTIKLALAATPKPKDSVLICCAQTTVPATEKDTAIVYIFPAQTVVTPPVKVGAAK